MSKTYDEFNPLMGELMDEFNIGEDEGEQLVLTNPEERHPVTGAIVKPAETTAIRGARQSLSDYEGDLNVQFGDVLYKLWTQELRGFSVTTNTTASTEGKLYGVENLDLSAKGIAMTIQCRSI